jgi:ParB-like chromosome segregation protein Spo0J
MVNKVGGAVIKNIKDMKINDLKPLDKNPFKSKGDRQIEKIAKSIENFERMMEIRKIVIDENNQILGGNKRYFALKKLGYKEIPDAWIERVTDLTEEQKKEFIIKDNAHWGSEWDFDLLEEWKVDLEDWGVEIEDFDIEQDFDYEDLIAEKKENPPTLKITFKSIEQLREAEVDIQDLIDKKYKGAFFSVSCGEL